MELIGSVGPLPERQDVVEFCLADLIQVHDVGEDIYKTLFYRIVRGGDTATVRRILERLQEEGNISVQNWVVHGHGHRSHSEKSTHTIPKYDFARITVAGVVMLGYLLVLPIFYAVHAIIIFVVNKLQVMVRDCDLILMPAVLSENQDMVALFKDHGVRLDSRDKHENNVFHWLVELSKTNVDQAKRCVDVLYSVYGHESCSAVNRQENFMGLIPLEACVSEGSLHFFSYLCHKPGVMRAIPPNTNQNALRLIESLRKVDQGYYEVTRYETGDYVNQSLILHCLRQVDIINEPADEVKVMFEDSFLSSYTKLKLKSFGFISIMRWIQQALFFVLFFLFVASIIDDNYFPRQFEHYVELYCQEAGVNHSQVNLAKDVTSAEQLATILDVKKCLPHNASVFAGEMFDVCGTKALKRLQATCPSSVTEEELLKDIGLGQDGLGFVQKLQNVPAFNYIFFISILRTLHQIVHGIIIIHHFYSVKQPVSRCTRMLLSRHFPGCYMQNQISILVRFIVIILYIIIHYTIPNAKSLGDMLTWVHHTTLMIVIATLMNMVSLIHSFRFVPSIGQFIITMFAMCKLLIQFAIITLALLAVFSMLFRIYLRNPDCPSVPMSGYTSMAKSIYNAYFLMLGMGPIPGGNRLIMYILVIPFTICTVLILLNLIIAVMSAIADNMMEYPWDYAIGSREIAVNVLESESMLRACLGPCHKYIARFLMKRTGYQIRQKRDGTNALYVTVYSP